MSTHAGDAGRATHMQRALGLSGAPNFRDAGGYATRDGGNLHQRRVFRSGHLAELSAADLDHISALELQLVVDLRREEEQRQEPSQLPPGALQVCAPITPGSHASAIYTDATQLDGAQAMADFMRAINRQFVISQSARFRALFAQLLESGAERVLFHCSAGKDRTGYAIAMLQLALGVAQRDIDDDYLLSRHYYVPARHMARVRRKYAVDHLSDEALEPMLRTDISYLRSAFEAIDEMYSDRESFLESALGLGASERRELRRRFVRSKV